MVRENFRLKPDYGTLNGYTDENQAHKEAFLRDAKKYLKKVGLHLASLGLPNSEYSVNQAGIAVSGEVYATYWDDHHPTHCVLCWVESSGIGRDRSDGVIIIVQVCELIMEQRGKKRINRKGRRGANHYPSTDLDSAALAQNFYHLYTSVMCTEPRKYPDSNVLQTGK